MKNLFDEKYNLILNGLDEANLPIQNNTTLTPKPATGTPTPNQNTGTPVANQTTTTQSSGNPPNNNTVVPPINATNFNASHPLIQQLAQEKDVNKIYDILVSNKIVTPK